MAVVSVFWPRIQLRKYGIPLKFAPEDVQEELKKHMPEFGSAKNPVDLTGMAGNEWYFDTVNFSICPQVGRWFGRVVLRNRHDRSDGYCHKPSKKVLEQTGIKDKPVAVSFVGGERSEKAMRWLVENGVPAYQAPDIALNAMAALREYAVNRESANDEPFVYEKADKKTGPG